MQVGENGLQLVLFIGWVFVAGAGEGFERCYITEGLFMYKGRACCRKGSRLATGRAFRQGGRSVPAGSGIEAPAVAALAARP